MSDKFCPVQNLFIQLRRFRQVYIYQFPAAYAQHMVMRFYISIKAVRTIWHGYLPHKAKVTKAIEIPVNCAQAYVIYFVPGFQIYFVGRRMPWIKPYGVQHSPALLSNPQFLTLSVIIIIYNYIIYGNLFLSREF